MGETEVMEINYFKVHLSLYIVLKSVNYTLNNCKKKKIKIWNMSWKKIEFVLSISEI